MQADVHNENLLHIVGPRHDCKMIKLLLLTFLSYNNWHSFLVAMDIIVASCRGGKGRGLYKSHMIMKLLLVGQEHHDINS